MPGDGWPGGIELRPRYWEAWLGKGGALMILGRRDDARAAFRRVEELGGPAAAPVLELLRDDDP